MPMADMDATARLGRYRLVERIGGGATSVVYAASDDVTGQRVAVKMIVADLADEREARARFYREANVTSEIRHRNIVAVLEVGEENGRGFLVMELLQGLPLDRHLRVESAQTLHARIDLIVQLHDGLQAAHRLGVVHRDIKPSNLFVQDDGCLKILDFGLARLQASNLTARGQVVGTPGFMSPEQAEGRGVDVRADIFSAAAVGYLILSGRAPFAGATLQQTLLALLAAEPVPLDETEAPLPLRRVLERGLAKNPDLRYQTTGEVLADLEEVRRALPPPALWQPASNVTGVRP